VILIEIEIEVRVENSIGGEIIRKMIETEVSLPLINGLPLLVEDLVQ